ncbi:uncharacterized protein [Watersipora subatra]|uniref:uncharacterized protein n=1 Tax=Watersipora subatra TaxID=2589382 RepID=UPI00355C5A51
MGVLWDGFFYIFIYLPIYFLFSLFQKLYWICNGMDDIVTQIEAGQLYERSAQVFDIWYKIKKEPFQLLGCHNFIATHNRFEHPNFVLSHNISLLAVQMDLAIFVEVPPHYDIFDCRKSPFIYLGQFSEAIRIITLPISSFIRCAEELGDPKMKVIWLHSTGRCGSTAISQVFEAVPNCTTVSEPMGLFVARNDAGSKYNSQLLRQWLHCPTYCQTYQATVRMMAKPNQHNPEVLFIKNFTLSGVREVADLETLFPTHTHLFLYRNCLETVQSYLRSLNNHFLLNVLMKLRGNACCRYVVRSPEILVRSLCAPEVIDALPWLSDPNFQLNVTSFGLIVIQWCCFLYHYNMLIDKQSSIRAIRYEDLVDNKHATLTKLFQFCGISLDHVEAAIKSLAADSQEGTMLSKASLSTYKKLHITDALRDEGNMYLKACNLNELGKPTYVRNSVSTPARSASPPNLPTRSYNGHVAISMPA